MILDGRRHFQTVLPGIVKERADVFGKLRPRLFVSRPFLFEKPVDACQEFLRDKVGNEHFREYDGRHRLESAAPLGRKCPPQQIEQFLQGNRAIRVN